MERVPDNYDAFCKYEAEQERQLSKRQVCDCCGYPITDDECLHYKGDYICKNCMETYYMVETPVEY